MTLREDLIRHEGLRLFPYRDSEGILTIGVGRNLERGISHDEAMYLLNNDIKNHAKELEDKFPIVHQLNRARRDVLINMAFNIGIPRLSLFKRMWAAIKEGDYDTAANEMLDSRWAIQVGSRANELSKIMAYGVRK